MSYYLHRNSNEYSKERVQRPEAPVREKQNAEAELSHFLTERIRTYEDVTFRAFDIVKSQQTMDIGWRSTPCHSKTRWRILIIYVGVWLSATNWYFIETPEGFEFIFGLESTLVCHVLHCFVWKEIPISPPHRNKVTTLYMELCSKLWTYGNILPSHTSTVARKCCQLMSTEDRRYSLSDLASIVACKTLWAWRIASGWFGRNSQDLYTWATRRLTN